MSLCLVSRSARTLDNIQYGSDFLTAVTDRSRFEYGYVSRDAPDCHGVPPGRASSRDPQRELSIENMANDAKAKPPQELSVILASAAQKALGGGVSGALAMIVQVVALMWMRTTINFQHKYGMSTSEALATLYSQGGIARFYQGMTAALLQAPLSRFGDTASYAGMTALLETVDSIPASLKTLCASLTAALFRIGITPIDTFKTTLQGQCHHCPCTLHAGASSFTWLLRARILSDPLPDPLACSRRSCWHYTAQGPYCSARASDAL